MTRIKGEKNLIQGTVSAELKEKLDRQIESQGFQIMRAVEAMVRLWVELPPETQLLLYSRSTATGSLESIIESIVRRMLARQHHTSALQAAEAHKGKVRERSARSSKSAG